MGRRGSSSRWLERQGRDHYVKQRQQDGYRSRAAYKLLEIDQRDRLLRRGMTIVDLGAAPGGWSQVAVKAVGREGRVIALDLLKIAPIAGAMVIEGDCRDAAVHTALKTALENRPVDLVMSDMAPNLSGIALNDEARSLELNEMCIDVVHQMLRPGGALVMKLFQYEDTQLILNSLKTCFGHVERRKPQSSRDSSREFYVVAKEYGI